MSKDVTNDTAVDVGDVQVVTESPATGNSETFTDSDTTFAENAAQMGLSVSQAEVFSKDDPELAKRLKTPRSVDAANKDNSGEEPADEGTLDSDDSAAKSEPDGASNEDAVQDEQASSDNSADDDSGDGDLEFGNGFIPGVKYKDFAKLPKETQEAVAEHFATVNEKVAEAETRLAELNALLEDPLVAQRKAAIEQGADITIRGMNDVERTVAKNMLINKLGIDDDEAEAVLADLIPTIDSIVSRAGQDVIAKQAEALSLSQKRDAEIKQGEQLLMGLSKVYPQVAVKETDYRKFYTYKDGTVFYNEKHPEIDKFKSGIGKVSEWAAAKGMNYGSILAMGEKPFYAAAGAALGLTDQRDKTIAANAKKSALEPFLVRKGATGLNLDGGAPVVPNSSGTENMRDGIDVVRLVEDDNYYRKVLDKDAFNSDWRDKLRVYQADGRQIIDKRKSKK